jgi:dihydromonapterin reductase/dihydrofolate reductase
MDAEPILITGVGRRVGLHLARTFLERGVPVIGTYRTQRDSLDDLRRRGAELHACDFDRIEDIVSLCECVTAGYSSLRAIIHNASDWLPDDDGSGDPAILSRMMQVHVTAPYVLNQRLAPLLAASSAEHADIIHIGDYVSSRGSRKHVAYAASKAAQDNMTLSFSARLAPRIKVNSIAPALVLFRDEDEPEYRDKTLAKSVLGRAGGLDELQRAVDYLLDSHYVTGRVLPMDGGRHVA